MPSLKTLLQLPCGWQYGRQVISSDGKPSISVANAKQHYARPLFLHAGRTGDERASAAIKRGVGGRKHCLT